MLQPFNFILSPRAPTIIIIVIIIIKIYKKILKNYYYNNFFTNNNKKKYIEKLYLLVGEVWVLFIKDFY